MKLAALLRFVAPRHRIEEVAIWVSRSESHTFASALCAVVWRRSRYADAVPELSPGLNAAFGPAAAVLGLGCRFARLFAHSSRATLTGSMPTCFHHAHSSPAR